jgi:anti-sigma B factor antagonist
MSLDIQQDIQEGIAVLTLVGRLTVSESNVLRERVTACTAAGNTRVVLDLTKLDYIDSTGLGTMVICQTSLTRQGGAAKLVNPNKRNVDLLLLTKLHSVFEVFNEVPDAVNSFIPGRQIKRFDILRFVQQNAEDDED